MPFVVVVSRTRNGFLARYTDIDGRFAFPDRPHRSGDLLTFEAAGYRSGSHQLESGNENVTYTMERSEVTNGRIIGLVSQPALRLEDSTSGAVADTVLINRHYRMTLTWTGRESCSQPGPVVVDAGSEEIIVAAAEFVVGDECGGANVMHDHVIEHVFTQPGPVTMRLRGRERDVVRQLWVVRTR